MAEKDTGREQRDRTGKEPLSKEARISLLSEIYDGLLFSWRQNVIMGSAKGCGAIVLQLQGARMEMTEMQRSYGSAAEAANILAILGFDPSLVITNGTGERIEA